MDWQCTEHGRLWSDPLLRWWTPDVLLHRVVDTAANVATSSSRHMEGQFVSLFVVPPCSPPWVAEMARGVHAYRTGRSHSHGSRHRRSDVAHAGQDAKLAAISITPLTGAQPLTV